MFRLLIFCPTVAWSSREFNSHRPTRRDATMRSRRIGSGGVNWALLAWLYGGEWMPVSARLCRYTGPWEFVDASSRHQQDDYLLSTQPTALPRGLSRQTLGGTHWLLLQHRLTTRCQQLIADRVSVRPSVFNVSLEPNNLWPWFLHVYGPWP